jgi:hypothetical protein
MFVIFDIEITFHTNDIQEHMLCYMLPHQTSVCCPVGYTFGHTYSDLCVSEETHRT